MMSEEQVENELSSWMSSYGLITANRILELYHFQLQQEELYKAIHNSACFYYRILKIPLKNVFNGIILEQAKDYQIYAQKMFIDYLMSGESSKSEESPGGFTREDLEKERKLLVEMTEGFEKCESEQVIAIANSQKEIIKKAKEWIHLLNRAVQAIHANLKSQGLTKNDQIIKRIMNMLLVLPEFTAQPKVSLKGDTWSPIEKIMEESLPMDLRQIFVEQLEKLNELNANIEAYLNPHRDKIIALESAIREWRTSFHDIIIRVTDLLRLLPEYHSNQTQILENQEALHFYSELGEKK